MGPDVSSDDDCKPRLIGSICVQKGLVTDEQLDAALARQEVSGEVLGEILVAQKALTRMQLADVLGEQWSEMAVAEPGTGDGHRDRIELRMLLEEAKVARAHLAELSEELGVRLTSLEHLVIGVNERLAELKLARRPRRSYVATAASTTGSGRSGTRSRRPGAPARRSPVRRAPCPACATARTLAASSASLERPACRATPCLAGPDPPLAWERRKRSRTSQAHRGARDSRGAQMINVTVTYEVKAERVAENEALVHAVYDELGRSASRAPLRDVQAVGRLHVRPRGVVRLRGEADGLSESASFRAFQADLRDRCEILPQPEPVTPIDSYNFAVEHVRRRAPARPHIRQDRSSRPSSSAMPRDARGSTRLMAVVLCTLTFASDAGSAPEARQDRGRLAWYRGSRPVGG